MDDLRQFDELCSLLESLAPDVAMLRSNAATPALDNLDEVRLRHDWHGP